MSWSVFGCSMRPELLFLFWLSAFTSAQSPAWIRLLPDRLQFFEYEQASLSCEHGSSEEWTVRRYTSRSLHLSQCGDGWGRLTSSSSSSVSSSSSCHLETMKSAMSGLYWCESRLGDSSNVINIIVTDEPVILHSPAHLVTPGSDVTLSCVTDSGFTDRHTSFYRDNVLIKTATASHMSLRQVSQLHVGVYHCEVGGVGKSPPSWLRVNGDLLPRSLLASTNWSQLVEYENMSLTCGGANDNNADWSVKRFTTVTKVLSRCGDNWGTPTPQGCFLQTLKQRDSALYWCESLQYQRSNTVNISIYDTNVTLRSPIRPVTAGDNVTLVCRATPPEGPATFYKDGYYLQTSPTDHMTLYHVTKADEGVYKCAISGGRESPPSWLFVRDHEEASRSVVSTVTVIRWFLVSSPYLVSTLLFLSRDKVKNLGLSLCTRRNGNSSCVTVVKARSTGEERPQNTDYEDISRVTTEHHF